METQKIQYDHYTLTHLVAAQLTAGMMEKGAAPAKAVQMYHQVLAKLSEKGLSG